MRQIKVIFIFLFILLNLTSFLQVNEVQAEDYIILKLKPYGTGAFSVLGRAKGQLLEIEEFTNFEADSNFEILIISGLQSVTKINETVVVEVYENYQGLYFENDTLKINGSLIYFDDTKRIESNVSFHQDIVSLPVYEQEVFVRIGIKDVYFSFIFKTIWEHRLQLLENIAILMTNFSFIITTVFFSGIGMFTSKRIMKLNILPRFDSNMGFPTLIFILGAMFVMMDLAIIRPPTYWFTFIGVLIILILPYSYLHQDSDYVKNIEVEDTASDYKANFKILKIGNKCIFIKRDSWLDFFARVIGKKYFLPVEFNKYLRDQGNHPENFIDWHFKIYGRNVKLPKITWKLEFSIWKIAYCIFVAMFIQIMLLFSFLIQFMTIIEVSIVFLIVTFMLLPLAIFITAIKFFRENKGQLTIEYDPKTIHKAFSEAIQDDLAPEKALIIKIFTNIQTEAKELERALYYEELKRNPIVRKFISIGKGFLGFLAFLLFPLTVMIMICYYGGLILIRVFKWILSQFGIFKEWIEKFEGKYPDELSKMTKDQRLVRARNNIEALLITSKELNIAIDELKGIHDYSIFTKEMLALVKASAKINTLTLQVEDYRLKISMLDNLKFIEMLLLIEERIFAINYLQNSFAEKKRQISNAIEDTKKGLNPKPKETKDKDSSEHPISKGIKKLIGKKEQSGGSVT